MPAGLSPTFHEALIREPKLGDAAVNAVSGRAPFQAFYYSPAQMGAAFGIDRQLMRDGTYSLGSMRCRLRAAASGADAGPLYGGDRDRTGPDPEFDPKRDAAPSSSFRNHLLKRAWTRAVANGNDQPSSPRL